MAEQDATPAGSEGAAPPAGSGADVPAAPASGAEKSAAPTATDETAQAQALRTAQAAIAKAKAAAGANAEAEPAGHASAEPQPLPVQNFVPGTEARNPEGIDLLSDVNLNVKIELGRTKMLVEDVLRLTEGSVVELDKLAGDPVDVYVNDRAVARGEVLVLNDSFCVRISEIINSPHAAAG
ncbi:MAG: flagellar motor switch protein FliN [Phycisphaerales bacterium]